MDDFDIDSVGLRVIDRTVHCFLLGIGHGSLLDHDFQYPLLDHITGYGNARHAAASVIRKGSSVASYCTGEIAGLLIGPCC